MQPKRFLLAAGSTALLATNATVLSIAGTAQAATTLTVPASIPADCSVDVSGSLGAFLGSVPNGADIEFPGNACYRVETEIDIKNKSGWVLHGNGTLLKRTQPTPAALQYPHANAFLRFINLSDSSIDGVNILGINTVSDLSYLRPSYGAYDTRYPFDHGFALEGATHVVLSNSKVDAVYGDGVYISGGDQYTGTRSDGVTVRGLTIDRNGRQGMSVSRSSDVVIDSVNIEHSRRAGIDLEPDSPSEVISNIEIKNSRIHSWLLAFASGGPGAVNHINIHDNTVTGSGVPFIDDASTLGTARSDWQIIDNKVTAGLGSPQPAMKFLNTSGVVIRDNYVPVATTQSRVEVGLSGTSAQISCNTFPGAGATYITADTSSSYTATDNSLTDTAPTCQSPSAPAVPPPTMSNQIPLSTTPTAPVTVLAPSGSTSLSATTAPSVNTIGSATSTDAAPADSTDTPTQQSSADLPPASGKVTPATPNAKAKPKTKHQTSGTQSPSAAAAGADRADPPDTMGTTDASIVPVDNASPWQPKTLMPAVLAGLAAVVLFAALRRNKRRRAGRPADLPPVRRHPLAVGIGLAAPEILPHSKKRWSH